MSLMNFLNSVFSSVFAHLVSCLTCISAITTSMSFALTIAFVAAPLILWSLWYQIIFCNVKYTNIFWVNNNIIFPPKMLSTEWLLCKKLRFTIKNFLLEFLQEGTKFYQVFNACYFMWIIAVHLEERHIRMWRSWTLAFYFKSSVLFFTSNHQYFSLPPVRELCT